MRKDEFYIGWKEELPAGYQRFTIIVISSIAILTVTFATLWVVFSNDFANGRFDYGNESIYKGVIHEYPAPMLVVDDGKDTTYIPLVNFGKYGVQEPIKFFNAQMRNNLLNYQVEIRGTTIEFDGKTWLELTKERDALLSFERLKEPALPIEVVGSEVVIIRGEIVDPKCFFGVMKPGFGKVHLSCGVPPILVSPNENGGREYYFVTDENGDPVNDLILPFVGIPIRISGQIKKVGEWNVLEMDSEDIAYSRLENGESIFDFCKEEEHHFAVLGEE